MSRICNSLADKGKFELTDKRKGGSYVFTIPLPITSGKHPVDMSSPPPSPDVNTPSHDVNSSRGAIDSSIDNTIDNIREKQALTIDLINEMKSKYPKKDIDSTLNKMLNYYKNKDVPLDFKFKQWCERERVDVGAVSDFKYDSTGNFRLGYCGGCGESASYKDNELNGDSKCKKRCRSTVMPDKEGFIRVAL